MKIWRSLDLHDDTEKRNKLQIRHFFKTLVSLIGKNNILLEASSSLGCNKMISHRIDGFNLHELLPPLVSAQTLIPNQPI